MGWTALVNRAADGGMGGTSTSVTLCAGGKRQRSKLPTATGSEFHQAAIIRWPKPERQQAGWRL
jgi:hypothetical protein